MKHSIWKRSLILVALLYLAPLCMAPSAWAQDGDLTPRLIKAGWQQIDTNVFQRQLEDGTVETVGWGAEMVSWELGHVQERLAKLEDLARGLDEPSAELLDALSFHHTRARELEAELDGGVESWMPLQPQNGELRSMAGALGCELIVTRNAYAYPGTSGPIAQATAAFSDTCNTFGKVKATAYAEGHYNGALRTSSEADPASGRRSGYGSASASASASVVATTACYSNAAARVWIQDSKGNMVSFTNHASNDICRIIVPNPLPGDCLSTEGLQGCTPLP